jgi:hypothetical protein
MQLPEDKKVAMSINLPARHLYAPNGGAMLEIRNHAGERIAVVYSTPAGVRIDAVNPGQFFSVSVDEASTNEEPRPSVVVSMTALPGADDQRCYQCNDSEHKPADVIDQSFVL